MCAEEGAAQAACAMPMAIIVDDRLDVSTHTLLRFRVNFLHTHCHSQTGENLCRVSRFLYYCAWLLTCSGTMMVDVLSRQKYSS